LVNVKQNPAYSSVRQVGADFIKSIFQWTAGWHANWPTELDSLDVDPDSLSVFDWIQAL
jgi:hypothetical protein